MAAIQGTITAMAVNTSPSVSLHAGVPDGTGGGNRVVHTSGRLWNNRCAGSACGRRCG
ncbi:MAG: hypothetical protein OXD45_12290 [Rhodobacteraceae bacterium]|nr:hypothetical protein [Paracoccaceae bacterium]